MVFSWVRRGLRTGILTTRYPAIAESMPQGFRGRPVLDASRCLASQGCRACVQVCLPAALSLNSVADSSGTGTTHGERQQLTLDYARCIMCGLCVAACPVDALVMTEEYEMAVSDREDLRLVTVFSPTIGANS
jgi:hydrogenase-4 component H